VAVFRGASTGKGTTVDTNMRLKIATIKHPCLDAGITDWNVRPRKIAGEKYLKTIEIHTLPIKLVSKLTPEEQSHFKYIVNIDGHSAAFRLSLELAMNSVVLKVNTTYQSKQTCRI
jgi:hypothetical protein